MNPEIDDDVVFSYNGIPTLEYQQSPTITPLTLWQSFVIWAVDVFTGPRFGVFAAIFAIIIVQYKSNIDNFVYNALEDGWQQTLLECILGFREMIRAYYQMACEVLRRIRQNRDPQPVQAVARSRNLMGSSPPPLVVLAPESETDSTSSMSVGKSCDMVETKNSTKRSPPSLCFDEIEPAFLDDQDYPPGWLVYHPRLGVVSKEEADKYDREHPNQLHPPILRA
jgi:hypothetical protein